MYSHKQVEKIIVLIETLINSCEELQELGLCDYEDAIGFLNKIPDGKKKDYIRKLLKKINDGV